MFFLLRQEGVIVRLGIGLMKVCFSDFLLFLLDFWLHRHLGSHPTGIILNRKIKNSIWCSLLTPCLVVSYFSTITPVYLTSISHCRAGYIDDIYFSSGRNMKGSYNKYLRIFQRSNTKSQKGKKGKNILIYRSGQCCQNLC